VSPSFRTTAIAGIELLQCVPLLERGVPHGFTLRSGGFGARHRDARDRERLAHALGLSTVAGMHQVHGNEIRILEEGGFSFPCDGLATDRQGAGVTVESADCVPLLLWASSGNAVAAVHAGWRGTLAGIAERAVSTLQHAFSARPGDIHAVLGPAIGVCCYEVGDEVIEAFAAAGRDVTRIARPGSRGRSHLDLLEENRSQLLSSGVAEERIHVSALCTYCENDRFYSFRREGNGVGRIFGAIGCRLAGER
jgi:YfiH family protein